MRGIATVAVGLLLAGVGGGSARAEGYDIPSGTAVAQSVPAPIAPLIIEAPPNDACTAPTAITTLPFTDNVDTTGASTDLGDPTHSCGGGASDTASVWYAFTAPGDGLLLVDTVDTNYDTVLALYRGTCAAAIEVACNDDTGDIFASRIGIPVTTGEELLVEASAREGNAPGSLTLNATLLPVPACPPPSLPVNATELLVNGDFESGTLAGWTATDTGSGTFVAAADFFASLSAPITTAGPACGSFYALSDQGDPGTHALAQGFEVPVGGVGVTLAFDLFVDDDSASGGVVDPIGLDHTGPTNQHARVDLLADGAGAFDTGADVLRNFYVGVDPDAPPNPYTRYSFDITDLAGAGGTFVVRFAETDNQSNLHVGVDNVSVAVLFTTTTTSTSTSSSTSTSTTLPVLLPGGKKAASDCYLEVAAWGFAALEPGAITLAKGRSEATCTDGDACDFGPCGDGVCTLRLEVCVNQTDPALAGCTAPEALDAVTLKTGGKNKSLLQLRTPPSLSGALCFGQDDAGTPFSVNLPAATQKKSGKLKGGTLDLRGFAKAVKGTKPRKDPDAFRLRCAPRTAACPG